jgi:hypothetical protein
MPNAVKFIGGFMILVVLFASYSSCRPLLRRQVAAVKTSAPASPLKAGLSGTLDGRRCEVRAHAVVEIGQVGLRYDRHEYQLVDENGNQALLVYGWKPGGKDWLLFTPLKPLEPLTPPQAAAVRWGQTVNLDGIVAPVSDLCECTIRQVDGAEWPDLKPGAVFFNFSGKTDSIWLLVRWREGGIAFYRGKALPTKEVIAAFNPQTTESSPPRP